MRTPETYFQLADEATLRIVGHGFPGKQSLGEMMLVVAFENILVGNEAEHGNGLIENLVHFAFGSLRGRCSSMFEPKPERRLLLSGHGEGYRPGKGRRIRALADSR